MLIWVACADTSGHVDVYGPHCSWGTFLGPSSYSSQGAYWCPCPMLPLKAMCMSWGSLGLCYHLNSCWWLWTVLLPGIIWMAMVSCYLRGQFWCPWKMLQGKTVNVHWDQAEAHGRCCHKKQWKAMIHATPDCNGQGSYFCSFNDCRPTVEKDEQRRFQWQTILPTP